MTATTQPDTATDVRALARLALAAVWLGVPAWASWEALGLLFHLFGESATAAEEAEAARWLTLGAVASVAAPCAALLLGGRRAWVAALIVGGLVAGVFSAGVADLRPAPAPEQRPYVCQERSGGDSDCPGG